MMIPDKFYRFLIGLAYAVAICFISIQVATGGGIRLVAIVLAIPIALSLLIRQDIAFVIACALHLSMVILPGGPNSLNVSTLCLIIFIGGSVLRQITHPADSKSDLPSIPLPSMAYGGILLMILALHGFGMRFMGSSMWGGGAAIAQFVFLALFILRRQIELTQKQLFASIILMLLGSAMPMLADALFVFSKGRIFHQFMIVQPLRNALRMAMGGYSHSVWRLQRASFFAPSLMELAFLLRFTKIVKDKGFIALCTLSLMCIGISGHRGSAIEAFAFSCIFLTLRNKQHRVRIIATICGVLIVSYCLLWLITPWMPSPFQRAISFVPGLPVPDIVGDDAAATLQWRFSFWKYILSRWREYFWLGTGFLHNPDIIETLEIKAALYKSMFGIDTFAHEYGMAVKDYHNGPIALLADLGIFGLLSGMWLIITIAVSNLKALKRTIWHNTKLKGLYTILVAKIVTETFVFIVIFGDVRSMLEFLFLGAFAAAILRCNARLAQNTETAGARNMKPGSNWSYSK